MEASDNRIATLEGEVLALHEYLRALIGQMPSTPGTSGALAAASQRAIKAAATLSPLARSATEAAAKRLFDTPRAPVR